MASRKNFSMRKSNRKTAHNVVSLQPAPGFLQFFEQAVGPKAMPAEIEKAVRFANRFKADLENPETPLRRLRLVWDRIVPFYPNLLHPERLESELSIISRHAAISPTDNIASLGSGPAILEAFIAKNLAFKGQVTCIDISPKFVRMARNLREKLGLKNMKILTGSATAIRLPDSSQDKVVISQTNLADTIHWSQVLMESLRVLKKGPAAKLVLTFASEGRKELPGIFKSLSANGFQREFVRSYAKAGNAEAIIIIASPQAKFWGKK